MTDVEELSEKLRGYYAMGGYGPTHALNLLKAVVNTQTRHFIAYNGETKELWWVPDAVDEDAARDAVDGENSDGDEFYLVEVKSSGPPVKLDILE